MLKGYREQLCPNVKAALKVTTHQNYTKQLALQDQGYAKHNIIEMSCLQVEVTFYVKLVANGCAQTYMLVVQVELIKSTQNNEHCTVKKYTMHNNNNELINCESIDLCLPNVLSTVQVYNRNLGYK